MCIGWKTEITLPIQFELLCTFSLSLSLMLWSFMYATYSWPWQHKSSPFRMEINSPFCFTSFFRVSYLFSHGFLNSAWQVCLDLSLHLFQGVLFIFTRIFEFSMAGLFGFIFTSFSGCHIYIHTEFWNQRGRFVWIYLHIFLRVSYLYSHTWLKSVWQVCLDLYACHKLRHRHLAPKIK